MSNPPQTPRPLARTATLVATALLTTLAALAISVQEAEAIPAFARKYQTACQTCHVIIPKLNTFGEAFRLNGYEIPDVDELFVKDEPLVLGAEPWKEMFPEAIWPSTIPGLPPIALRLITDIQRTESDAGIGSNPRTKVNFEFPHEFEMLTGGRMGQDIGFFGEVEWKQGGGADIKQGYLFFSDPIGPDHRFNLKVGLIDPQLLLTHNNTTRVGKNHPLWGNKTLKDWGISGLPKSTSGFRHQDSQAGIEASGFIGDRFFWGAGVVNGNGGKSFDDNPRKDVYFKAKVKLGGRNFFGRVPDGGDISMDTKASGGWVDDSFLLEAFGYIGQATQGPLEEDFNFFGVAGRALVGDLDLAAGFIHGHHDNPWFVATPIETDGTSWFAKAEYMFYPWVMGRVLFETLDWDEPAGTGVGSGYGGSLDQKRILFGPVFAVRANVRLALEAEIYTDHTAAEVNRLSKPHNLWLRLDYAF